MWSLFISLLIGCITLIDWDVKPTLYSCINPVWYWLLILFICYWNLFVNIVFYICIWDILLYNFLEIWLFSFTEWAGKCSSLHYFLKYVMKDWHYFFKYLVVTNKVTYAWNFCEVRFLNYWINLIILYSSVQISYFFLSFGYFVFTSIFPFHLSCLNLLASS